MTSRWKTPRILGEILKQALEKWDLAATFKRYQVMGEWETIVGGGTAKKSRPLKFQGENLWVEVDHPAWVQELTLLKPEIIKKIKEKFPKTGIKNIRFILK